MRKRWDTRREPRDLLTGAGSKPPEAAWIKSLGGERVWLKGLARRGQVWYQETNESEPSDDVSKVSSMRSKAAISWCVVKESIGNLFTGWAASGIKAA